MNSLSKKNNNLLYQSIAPFININKTYCIGLSGGSDSILLLRILKNSNIKRLVALHLNHSLRAEESDEDELFCKNICKKLNIELITKKINVKNFAIQNQLSIEDAARKCRYKWFADTCKKLNAEAIFIAHHADDQAETIMLRLLRGTGLNGLGGIKKITHFNNLKIIRPWLDIPKHIINEEIKNLNIEFKYDSSNSNLHFDRNWIRHFLFPEINKHYNSNIRDKLNKTAAIAAETYDFINQEAQKIVSQNLIKSLLGLLFPINVFKNLHSALQSEILRIIISKIYNEQIQIPYSSINEIKNFISSKALRCSVKLPRNISISKAYDYFFIGASENLLIKRKCIEIGQTISINENLILSIKPINQRLNGISDNGENWELFAKGKKFIMRQFASIPSNAKIIIRARKSGDIYHPVNGKKTKVKNFLISAKIPQKLKNYIPILELENNILWLTGWRISEMYKVNNIEKSYQLVILELRYK